VVISGVLSGKQKYGLVDLFLCVKIKNCFKFGEWPGKTISQKNARVFVSEEKIPDTKKPHRFGR